MLMYPKVKPAAWMQVQIESMPMTRVVVPAAAISSQGLLVARPLVTACVTPTRIKSRLCSPHSRPGPYPMPIAVATPLPLAVGAGLDRLASCLITQVLHETRHVALFLRLLFAQ